MLEVAGLTKSFGGLVAVDNVSFTLGQDEIVGLIGPNGAGKTTLFNTVTGLFSPDEGDVTFEGRSLVGLRPSEICARGVVRSFQIVRTFDESTVLENVLTGAVFGAGGDRSLEAARATAREYIEFVGLEGRSDVHASDLPIAAQKQVELARGLACEPKLLMIDEMGAGLTPAELDDLVDTIDRIRSDLGVSVFWIEHVMEAILGTTDRVLVLDNGSLIAEGPPDAIRDHERVQEAYLGDTV